MSSHKKDSNLSIKVNGREVENPAARMVIALVMGIAGVAVLALGMLILTGALIFMVPIAGVLIIAAAIATIFARKG